MAFYELTASEGIEIGGYPHYQYSSLILKTSKNTYQVNETVDVSIMYHNEYMPDTHGKQDNKHSYWVPHATNIYQGVVQKSDVLRTSLPHIGRGFKSNEYGSGYAVNPDSIQLTLNYTTDPSQSITLTNTNGLTAQYESNEYLLFENTVQSNSPVAFLDAYTGDLIIPITDESYSSEYSAGAYKIDISSYETYNFESAQIYFTDWNIYFKDETYSELQPAQIDMAWNTIYDTPGVYDISFDGYIPIYNPNTDELISQRFNVKWENAIEILDKLSEFSI